MLHPPANGTETQSLAAALYGFVPDIMERHRHRYEVSICHQHEPFPPFLPRSSTPPPLPSPTQVNPEKVQELEAAGLNLVGRDETKERMEIAELPRSVHPFYFGTQYHPEFKSRPLAPSPPFLGLLLAASGQLDDWLQSNGPGANMNTNGSAATVSPSTPTGKDKKRKADEAAL